MKNTLLFIFLNLFLFSSIYAQKLDGPPTTEEWQDHIDQLEAIFNNSQPVVNLNREYLFQNNSQSLFAPGLGLNPSMGYGAAVIDIPPSEFHLGVEEVQNAITTMQPSHLRFPFGTPGNSFNHVGRLISFSLPTENSPLPYSDISEEYFIEDLPSNLGMSPSTSEFDYTILYEEGSVMLSRPYVLMSGANSADDNYDDFFVAVAGSPNLRDFLMHTAQRKWIDNVEIENDDPDFHNWTRLESNILKDQINMTFDSEIEPVYLLKMFDPLEFVVQLEDLADNTTDIYFSPFLAANVFEVDNMITPQSFTTNSNHFDEVSQVIVDSSLEEVRRQIIKIVYEYVKEFDGIESSPSYQTEFNNFLNGTNLDANDPHSWTSFLDFIDNHPKNLNLRQLPLKFELGNELYLRQWYKFIPNFAAITDPSSLWANPGLYVDISIAASEAIKSVFPLSEIGVVARKNGQSTCNWNSTLINDMTIGEPGDQADALILHFYNAFDEIDASEPVAQFDEGNILSFINRRNILAPAADVLWRFERDNTPVSLEGITHWYTEIGTHQEGANILTGPTRGSWFDVLAKMNIWNQMVCRNERFQNNLNDALASGAPSNAAKIFNNDSSIPRYDIDFMMGHSLFGANRSSIIVDFVDANNDGNYDVGEEILYNYTDHGFQLSLLNRATNNNMKHISPLIFTQGGNIPGNTFEFFGNGNNACGNMSPGDYDIPGLWGWVLSNEDDAECTERRFLLVNSTEVNCVVGNFNVFSEANSLCDIYAFDVPGYDGTLEAIEVMEDYIEALNSNADINGTLTEGHVRFYSGSVQELNDVFSSDSPFAVDGEIEIPPFSIIIFTADDGLISDNLSEDDFLYFGYEEANYTQDIWTEDRTVSTQDVIIADGETLTISDCKIQFAPNRGIIVQAGGQLIIENSTLTSQYCQNTWRGIDVQGDPNLSQSPTGTNQYDQGRIDLSNSTIRNAEIALTNFNRNDDPWSSNTTGGILKCSDSEFINCNRAVQMAPYFNYVSSGLLHADVSIFERCEFVWDETFDEQVPDQINAQVFLEKVNDVKFHGCEFRNLNLNQINITPGIMTGVYASFASIKLTEDCADFSPYPCPEENITQSKVKGFEYGLYLNGAPSSVTKTEFQNAHSIFSIGAVGGRYTENDFRVLEDGLFIDQGDFEWHSHYGMYMHTNTGYWIEGNNFDFSCSSEDRNGLIILNSGGFSNQVYDNTFRNCTFGTIAYDSNRGDVASIGLNYDCNDYLFNSRDLNSAESDIALNTLNFGIAMNQGVAPGVNPTGISAGNYFEGVNLLGSEDYDLRNDITGYTVNYYYHINDNLDNTSQGVPAGFTATDDLIDENGCPSNLDRDRLERLATAAESNTDASDNKAVLDALVDGGDTQELLTDVILAQYQDALELYYELMAESPYLSEEVMTEAIQREAELPAVLLTLILQSNPHAAKSSEVNQRLDERVNLLSQYQRDMVNQGLAIIGSKESLESRYAHDLKEYEVAMNQAIYLTLQDENITNKIAAIDAELMGKESLSQRYYRAQLYANEGNFAMVNQILADADNDFEMSDRQLQELEDMEFCYGILENASTSLSTSEITQLNAIAENENSFGAGMARALLNRYEPDMYYEPLVNPLLMEKARSTGNGKPVDIENPNDFKIYPNPAHDYIVIEANNSLNWKTLFIRDQKGRLVQSLVLGENGQIQLVDVSPLASGLYQLSIEDESGQKVYTNKLTINR